MTTLDSRAKDGRDAAAAGDGRVADIVTAEVIGALHAHTSALDHRSLSALDMLCRKIALAPVLYERYRHDWTTVENAAPLQADEQERLVTMLLRIAALHADANPEVRGRALKCLNAAFTVLRNAERCDPPLPRSGELRAAASAIAASIR